MDIIATTTFEAFAGNGIHSRSLVCSNKLTSCSMKRTHFVCGITTGCPTVQLPQKVYEKVDGILNYKVVHKSEVNVVTIFFLKLDFR